MPTYRYLCKACSHELEEFQSIKADPLVKCPDCGKKKLERQIGPGAGFLFKGDGFYITDYRSESYKSGKEAESGSKETKESPKSDTGSSSDGGSPGSTTGSGDAGGSGSGDSKSTSPGKSGSSTSSASGKGTKKSGGDKKR